MFFTKEKGQQYQPQGYLRRICDLTSPNLPRLDDSRGDDRHNRTIPVLLTPWENGMPVASEAATALTRDISDRGLSVTLSQAFHAEKVVVGFWLARDQGGGPWFFLGNTRQIVPIGGGFWGLGIEVIQRLNTRSEVAELLPLIRDLLPPKAIETAPPSALLR